MENTTLLSVVLYGATLFILGVLAADLYLDYKWSREARAMKIKRGWKS